MSFDSGILGQSGENCKVDTPTIYWLPFSSGPNAMSLWHKPLSEVSFQDIEDFCEAQYPEGVRLDYKEAIPSKLEKTVAAFANTSGGLLVLGVKADQTTNRPKLPLDGMESAKGLTERVTQICRDAIYPPIVPEISQVIESPEDNERVFLVVRVDASPHAPHAVEQGKKVYLRTGDTNNPLDIAEVGQIELLLQRRTKACDLRESLLQRQIDRCLAFKPTNNPVFWWFVSPELPSQEICSLSNCQQGVFKSGARRALDGYVYLHSNPGQKSIWTNAGCSKFGDLFLAKQYNKPYDRGDGNTNPRVDAMNIANWTYSFLNHSHSFLTRSTNFHPGLLRVEVGGFDTLGMTMSNQEWEDGDSRFLDPSFRIKRVIALEQLADDNTCKDAALDLMVDFFHAFDLTDPPPKNYLKLLS